MLRKLCCSSPLLLMGALFSLSIPLATFASQVLSPPVVANGSSTGPIISATNNGSGNALIARARGNTIEAISQHQNGFVGVTQFSNSTATNNGAGVIGFDGTSSAFNQGVSGESINGTGVFAQSTTNINRAGAQSGAAIRAVANGGAGIVSTVLGATNGTNCGLPGISAFSPNASAVLADSSTDPCGGLPYSESVGVATMGTAYGVLATATAFSKGAPAIAVDGTGDIGGRFVATGNCPIEYCSYLPPPNALEVQQNGSGLVVYALGTNGGLSLDNNGNLIISGKLTQHGTPGSAAAEGDTAFNRPIFSTNVNAATIENVGEGRIVSGQSYVLLDNVLVRKMDFSQAYQVVVTPEGPSAGVYVTDKSSKGFAVRENPGGHSTFTFSYRLVAKARTTPRGLNIKRLDTKNEDRAIARLKTSAHRYGTRVNPKLSL